MLLTAYLNFDGTCREAFEFYARAFKAKIGHMQSFADSPMSGDVPPEFGHRIMHARIDVGDNQMLMGSDTAPGMPFNGVHGFAVSVTLTDPAEADRIFNALVEGGKVTMPIAETFWAKRFGMCVDRFGIPWIINCPTTA